MLRYLSVKYTPTFKSNSTLEFEPKKKKKKKKLGGKALACARNGSVKIKTVKILGYI